MHTKLLKILIIYYIKKMLNIITGKKATGYEGIRLKMKRLINIKKKTL